MLGESSVAMNSKRIRIGFNIASLRHRSKVMTLRDSTYPSLDFLMKKKLTLGK
jgi:hypothetical protein